MAISVPADRLGLGWLPGGYTEGREEAEPLEKIDSRLC